MTRVSLVVGSVARTEALERLLGSVREQRLADCEVVIVEQRNVELVSRLCAEFRDLDVRVIEAPSGLSRARNAGLRTVSGDIVGFPDDDCWYEVDSLKRVVEHFERQGSGDVLAARVLTVSGDMIPYPRARIRLTRANIWRTVVSPGLFISAEALAAVPKFDERLGLGADSGLGSGEETDFALRLLSAGLTGWYEPDVRVHHPSPDSVGGRLRPPVGVSYGRGAGWVMRRHSMPRSFVARSLARPAVGGIVAALRGDSELARFRLAVVRGRFAGYVSAGTSRQAEDQQATDE